MNEFILSLIKYTTTFMCILYAFTKLLHIKLKALNLLDIPIFIVFSAVLHFVKLYVKILVPIGLLFFGIVFLFLRFRKTFYETVTVSTIALGISIIGLALGVILGFPIATVLYLIKNDNVKIALAQLTDSIIQVASVCLLFKIKRLQSGVNPKGETATFDILLFLSVGCIFTMMIVYTKNVTHSIYETFLLITALFGLLLIIWWRRHITYTYREAVKQQNVNRLEETIEELKISSAENDYKVAVNAKLFHYLKKSVPDSVVLAESAAAQTGNADAVALLDLLHNVSSKLDLAVDKCNFEGLPLTGERIIDAPLIRLYAAAEQKNFNFTVGISADVESWFVGGNLHKTDINTLINYLGDNAIISALALPNAKVRVELGATESNKPLLRIYDSGEQFDEEVISKLGLEQFTTRAGVGGSGIGLYTVFEILERYGASFTLDEILNADPPQNLNFTKCIEIAFDGRNAITVRTCRESVVAVCAKRKGITAVWVERSEDEVLRDGTNG